MEGDDFAVEARHHPERENRYQWRLHYVSGPQHGGCSADGGFGHYHLSKVSAEDWARDHCLTINPET